MILPLLLIDCVNSLYILNVKYLVNLSHITNLDVICLYKEGETREVEGQETLEPLNKFEYEYKSTMFIRS